MKTILVFHIFCVIAIILDAWYNSLVIKKNNHWHTVQVLFIGWMGAFFTYLWFFPDCYYCSHKPGAEVFIIPFIYIGYRFCWFNLVLNLFMKWDWWYLGTTSWLDKNLRGFWRIFLMMFFIVFTIYFTTFFLG